MIHLDDDAIEQVCDLPSVTEALISAWKELAAGDAATTVRVRASAGGVLASGMAAVLPGRGVAGGKLYVTHPGGMEFLVALFEVGGRLLATLDGAALTGIRTAAATAVAVRHLQPPGARVAALLGTGRQSTHHARALAQELDLSELRVWGRTPQSVEGLVSWCRGNAIPAVARADAEAAVQGADVVATVTASYEPLFAGAALAHQALVCAVGATKAGRRELDGETVRRADLVFTDGVAGAMVECGDLVRAADEGVLDWGAVGDLADVVVGTAGRRPDTGIVLFESQGIALQDVATAALAYERLAGDRLQPAVDVHLAGEG